MRTDDYKQSPYTPAVPDGEFPTCHYYIRDYLDKQEEKIVTLPEVIVVAPACPRDKGELLIPTFNTNINYDDYKK